MQTRTIEGGVTFPGLTVKTIVVHTATYFVTGLLALRLLEYRTAFEAPITTLRAG